MPAAGQQRLHNRWRARALRARALPLRAHAARRAHLGDLPHQAGPAPVVLAVGTVKGICQVVVQLWRLTRE